MWNAVKFSLLCQWVGIVNKFSQVDDSCEIDVQVGCLPFQQIKARAVAINRNEVTWEVLAGIKWRGGIDGRSQAVASCFQRRDAILGG